MKRFDYRILIGAALILGGILMLLDITGVLSGATGYFWAGALAIAAIIFLAWFLSDRNKWWAAIPGFTLAGLAATNILAGTGWGGFIFLGCMGLGFWAVYIRIREHWWAIIPGGVLVTLGVIAMLTDAFHFTQIGGVFFVGLGITFLLVALLAKMKWAYIPAAVLLILGVALGMVFGAPFVGVMQYVWIGILLVAGVVLLISAFSRK